MDIAAIQTFCERRVPPKALDQVRVEAIVEGNAVTIVERRPPWRADADSEWTTQPIARLRYVHKHERWSLSWRDRDERWHRYDDVAPATSVTALLDEIERDPAALFWG